MTYELELSPRAERSLDRIPRADFLKIDPAIRQLADDPRPHGVKKLKGDIHRIKTGPWRIIFLVLDDRKLVSVIEVVRRSESTYKGYGG